MKKIFTFLILITVSVSVTRAYEFAANDTVYETFNYGEACEIGDSVITYSGTFKFKKPGTANDYTVYIITFEPINAASQYCITPIKGDTLLHTTVDTVIDLIASGDDMDFYEWYALENADKNNLVGDKSLDHIKVRVHPKDTAVYILKTMKEEEANIVYNGDFEEGNKGFWSQYSYTTEAHGSGYAQGLGPEGRYAGGANPNYYHQNFCDFSGSTRKKMLIANGNAGTDKVVYAATFDVEPNQNYIVSFEAANVSSAKEDEIPQFQFSVSGEKLGSVFKISQTKCEWKEYYQIWNSGSHTNATITILNQNTKASGNDFAIDNITYRKMCTAYDTIRIINDVTSYDTIDVVLCEGESYDFNGKILSEQGVYYDTLVTSVGYDSVIMLNLTVNPVYEIHLDTSICEGEHFMFNDQLISEQGIYKVELTTQDGCDSTVFIDVVVNPVVYKRLQEEIYSWQDYFFDGQRISKSGEYTATFESEAGCDSIVTLWIKVNDKVYINEDICEDVGYVFGDKKLTESGTYNDTLKAANGNDSVVVLTLNVWPVYTDTIKAEMGVGQVYDRQGFYETESGTYIHQATTAHGCDSSVVLILDVFDPIDIWVPNAFVPTSDENNIFYIFPSDEDVVIDKFRIYNRWGAMVFETDDITQGWDGKYKGAVCKQGIYVYEVTYYRKGWKRKMYQKKGEIFLQH